LYELPLQGRQAASRKENHSLFIIIVEKRLLGYLFRLYIYIYMNVYGRRRRARQTDRQNEMLPLPSTFNNEKRLPTHYIKAACLLYINTIRFSYKQGSSLSTVKTVPNQQ
jgi:hypothetical protein